MIDIVVEEEWVEFCHNTTDDDIDLLEFNESKFFEEIGEIEKVKHIKDRLGKRFE